VLKNRRADHHTMKKDGTIQVQVKGKAITIIGSGKINVKATATRHERQQDPAERLTLTGGVERKQDVKKHSENREVCVMDVPSAASALGGPVTGTFARVTSRGEPLVDVSGATFHARSCVALHACDVGKDVVVVFDTNRPDSPIVLGVIQPVGADAMEVTVDDKHVAFTAQERLTLRCGNASITLDRDGKIVIRGAQVVSQASGVNRIRGGSVELN
jgi:uncharacterized protein (DUF2345 family)